MAMSKLQLLVYRKRINNVGTQQRLSIWPAMLNTEQQAAFDSKRVSRKAYRKTINHKTQLYLRNRNKRTSLKYKSSSDFLSWSPRVNLENFSIGMNAVEMQLTGVSSRYTHSHVSCGLERAALTAFSYLFHSRHFPEPPEIQKRCISVFFCTRTKDHLQSTHPHSVLLMADYTTKSTKHTEKNKSAAATNLYFLTNREPGWTKFYKYL